MSPDQEEKIKALTQQAVAAAESGHWDQVIDFYERRARDFSLSEASPDLVQKLIALDRIVQVRAQVIQTATRQHLLDIQERRRKLQQFKQRWIHNSQPTSNVSHEI